MCFSGIVIFFWKGQTISIKVCFICHSILKIICQLKKLKSIETIVLVSFSLSSGICEDFFLSPFTESCKCFCAAALEKECCSSISAVWCWGTSQLGIHSCSVISLGPSSGFHAVRHISWCQSVCNKIPLSSCSTSSGKLGLLRLSGFSLIVCWSKYLGLKSL